MKNQFELGRKPVLRKKSEVDIKKDEAVEPERLLSLQNIDSSALEAGEKPEKGEVIKDGSTAVWKNLDPAAFETLPGKGKEAKEGPIAKQGAPNIGIGTGRNRKYKLDFRSYLGGSR